MTDDQARIEEKYEAIAMNIANKVMSELMPGAQGPWAEDCFHLAYDAAIEALKWRDKNPSDAVMKIYEACKHDWLMEELSCTCGYYGDDTEETGMSQCPKCAITEAIAEFEKETE